MIRVRSRWFVVGLLAVAVVAVSAVVSIADNEEGDIVLVLDSTLQEFQYDNQTQIIRTGKAECKVTSASKAGPIMTMSSSTYNSSGNQVVGHIGLVEDGLGVNLKGNGDGQECGRVDYLGGGLSETLTLELGDAIAGRMMNGVTFDIEAKFDATMRVEFLRNGEPTGDDFTHAFSTGSDSGPDSKFRDKYQYQVFASSTAGLFDGVRISMISGSTSLEGGATWEYSENPEDAPHLRRTVFHLVDANPSVAITSTTDQANDTIIATGQSVVWTYTVTNDGDLPLTDISVTDSDFGPATCAATSLGLDESTQCTVSGTAREGDQQKSGSVTANSPLGPAVSVTDSSYLGSSPAIHIEVTTNGFDESLGTNYIEAGTGVTWTYAVTNTGNVALQSVSVTDNQSGVAPAYVSGDDDSDNELDRTEEWIYTATADAVDGEYANTGTVDAVDPIGQPASDTDDSSYFGSNPSVLLTVTNNGPLVIIGSTVIWVFEVDNTGNVALELVFVTQDGTEVCNLGTVQPGGTGTCGSNETAVFGEVTPTFAVMGTPPVGVAVDSQISNVGYHGSLGCGDGHEEGLPGLNDTPRVGFVLGPDNGLKREPACLAPVEITSYNDGIEQVVSVGPPGGYTWGGVTGIVTIEWDAETPAAAGVPPPISALVRATQ